MGLKRRVETRTMGIVYLATSPLTAHGPCLPRLQYSPPTLAFAVEFSTWTLFDRGARKRDYVPRQVTHGGQSARTNTHSPAQFGQEYIGRAHVQRL